MACISCRLPASVEELKSGHSQEEDEGCDGVEDFNGKRTCKDKVGIV